jgi:hypothetical protein
MTIEMKPNIVHLKHRAEEVSGYLKENGPYDCLVCDMANLKTAEIFSIFDSVVDHLKPGAPFVSSVSYL